LKVLLCIFCCGIALQNKSFKIGLSNSWKQPMVMEGFYRILFLNYYFNKNGGSLQNYFLKYKMAKLIGLTGGIGSGQNYNC
jgi:hypothetical protein